MERHDSVDRLLARLALAGLSAAATLAYAYGIYGIAQVPNGDGSGFQWVALVPYTQLYAGVLALILYVYQRNSGRASAGQRPETPAGAEGTGRLHAEHLKPDSEVSG